MDRAFPKMPDDDDFNPRDINELKARFEGNPPQDSRSQRPPRDARQGGGRPSQDEKPQDVQQLRREAEVSRANIERSYTHGSRTLWEWEILMEFLKYVGFGLAVADGVFSLWALSVSLENKAIAMALSIAIGGILFATGVAIATRALDDFLVLDKNEDDRVSVAEFFWFGIKVLSLLVAVLADVFTNYLGMNQAGARNLLPAEIVPGWTISLFLAIFLMVAPHVLTGVCDVTLRKIARKKAIAEMESAEAQGAMDYAVGYRKEVAGNTREAGIKEGKARASSYKIRW